MYTTKPRTNTTYQARSRWTACRAPAARVAGAASTRAARLLPTLRQRQPDQVRRQVVLSPPSDARRPVRSRWLPGSTDPITNRLPELVSWCSPRDRLRFRLPHAPYGRRPHAVHVPTPVAPALEQDASARFGSPSCRPMAEAPSKWPPAAAQARRVPQRNVPPRRATRTPTGLPEPLETMDRLLHLPLLPSPFPTHPQRAAQSPSVANACASAIAVLPLASPPRRRRVPGRPPGRRGEPSRWRGRVAAARCRPADAAA